MVDALLLLYLRDRSRAIVLVAALASLLVALALLAFVAFVGAGTADSSVVDGRLVGPFRWDAIDSGDG